MQTYQSKYSGKEIDDNIAKIPNMQTSIQNNANQITNLKTVNNNINTKINNINNEITNLKNETDTYEFAESYYQSLISTIGMVIPIAPSEIEKYKYFVVNYKEGNTENRAKFRLPYSYSMTTNGETTYYYMLGEAYIVLELKYNSSTTMIAKLSGSGIR